MLRHGAVNLCGCSVGDELLLSRLENDVLQDVGLIKDAVSFHKQQVKVNTRQLYTQQKYNLFREETEGYSKLIAELSELPAATDYTSTRGCKSAAEVIQNLQSLIGYFDLDPNRVLDREPTPNPGRPSCGAPLALFRSALRVTPTWADCAIMFCCMFIMKPQWCSRHSRLCRLEWPIALSSRCSTRHSSRT